MLWVLTALGSCGAVALWIWLLLHAAACSDCSDAAAMLAARPVPARPGRQRLVPLPAPAAARRAWWRRWKRRRTNWGCFPKCWCGWSASSSDRRCWPRCAPRWMPRASRPRGAWRGLKRLMEYLDSRDNVFVRVARSLHPVDAAPALSGWKTGGAHSGPAVRRWLAATGEIEALCSLASHAFEHPADPFPEFARSRPAGSKAAGIGHPLIPEDRVVRNDVRIGGELRVLVVSGSNMSGKSTLLRTLGVNAVLAQAGAPVRARGCASRRWRWARRSGVTDSLQGGISRFYAEILRLRQILDLTARPAAGAVPDRRVPARHQLPRPAHRRRGAGARPGGARRHRA